MDKFVEFLKKNDFKNASIYYRAHYTEKDFTKSFKQSVNKLERKKYYYMITFTLAKDYTEKEYKEIEKFIETQAFRPALQIEKASIVKELTKRGRPHWHMSIVSTKIIKKDRFNYYANLYGTIDISKNRHNNDSEMMNYMSKSAIIKPLI